MNRNFVIFMIMAAALLISCQPIVVSEVPAGETPASEAPASEAPGPAEVMDAYTAAINAHDVEQALSYVAEDAVYSRPTGDFRGKEEIRGFVEGIIARNVQVELVGERQVDGDRVTWTSRVRLDDPENPDGPPLEIVNNSESVVQNGLIVSHTATRGQ